MGLEAGGAPFVVPGASMIKADTWQSEHSKRGQVEGLWGRGIPLVTKVVPLRLGNESNLAVGGRGRSQRGQVYSAGGAQ